GEGDGLAALEAFYAEHGLPAAVQVTPADRHSALDARLAARGYRSTAPVLALTAPAARVAEGAGARGGQGAVELAGAPTAAWLDAFHALDGGGDGAVVSRQVLPRIADPAGYACAVRDGRVAGIALFVASAGAAGVFCVAVRPDCRRRGVAEGLLRAGAHWALGRGAEQLYLQVAEANDAARRLYERAGFTLSHRYHYRVRE
ncbi:GNAT family N-acetyltransferase, partial [Streptomyces boncukensis]